MRPVLLTVTAVGMLASSALSPFNGSEFGPGAAITPPGGFFAIWGVVIALCLAVAAMSWRRDHTPVFDAAGWPLVIAQLGFSAWLLVASYSSGPGTVAVFAVILGALLIGMARLRAVAPQPGLSLVNATIGLYAGWSSAAIWLNVITTSPARIGDSPVAQAAALAGAGITATLVLKWLRPSVAYPAAVAWALVGVALTAFSNKTWLPLAVVLVDLVIVVALAFVNRIPDRRSER